MHMTWCVALLVTAWLQLGNVQCQNPCDDPAISKMIFCDYKQDIVTRVTDLLERLTAEEKVSQIGHTAPAIDRLKIPAYQWWSEALHGVANSPGVHFGGKVPSATSFPQIIGVAASFNMSLVKAMGEAISTEARAMYNQGQSGLTFFAPNINIFRDPRWGRGQETPGEDPYLAAQYAQNFVMGMQTGRDYRYVKAAVCCKHFAAYDLENWNGTDRHHFNAVVTDQDLIETYFPAFEACVREGLVASIMCSYNAVNGVPSCANDLIQNKVVRDQWGFKGFIVSDCGAIGDIMNTHKYTSTPEDTVKAALEGGTDLNCGGFYQKYGMDAYNKGKITDSDLDYALGRLFGFRMALGMFDPVDIQPYWNITTNEVNSKEHQALALDASRQSIVLLKNGGALPLKQDARIALIGPNANATTTMQGNYNGVAPFLISPLEGLQNAGVSVKYVMGCDVKCEDDSGFTAAADAARNSDVVVIVVGLDQSQESEGHDRDEISLPGKQEELLDTVKKALVDHEHPVIVILMSGSPVDIRWATINANSVLWVGYPGQAGGQAIADVLLGHYNPSGKLPFTIYPKDYVNQISFFDMSMRTPPGRTYKFYTGSPIYKFGDGLSYTSFSYQWSSVSLAGSAQYSEDGSSLVVSKESLQGSQIDYEVVVKNTGQRLGGAVAVLAYLKPAESGAPLMQLFGFQKVYLNPGASVKLFFAATASDLSLVNEQGQKQLYPGQYVIQIGELEHNLEIV